MLIGFDGSRAFNKERTGTENYSYQLLLHLAKIDKDNSYLVYLRPECHPERSEGYKSRDSSRARNDNFGWPANFNFKTLNYSRFWTQVGLALATFKDPLDVLFVPAHTLPLIRKPNLKTVMTVHDLGSEYLPKMHQFKQRLYLGFITKLQLKGASRLVAVSKATKEDLVKKIGIDPTHPSDGCKKVEVVYEAVNREIFKPANGVLLRNILNRFDLEKENYFIFVGTIQPRKNLSRLIEAFARFRDKNQESRIKGIKLVLAGGRGWLSDEIYQLPEKLGISEQVKLLGRVSDQELSALLTGATALVFPSLFEGFGLPILEAFACSCPVLTSEVSSMPEVAGEAAVLVDPYNIESIEEGMERVRSSEFRAQMVKKGREQLEKFSWEKAARETLKVIKDVSS